MLNKLEDEMGKAIKAGDRNKLKTLRLIKSEVVKEMTKRSKDVEFTNGDMESVLRRMVKQREESIKEYNTAGRGDLSELEMDEIDVIKDFLPNEPTEAELREYIEQEIAAYRLKMEAKDPFFKLSMRDTKAIAAEVSQKYSSGLIGRLTSEILKSHI